MTVVDPVIVRSHFAQLDQTTADLLLTTLVEDLDGLGNQLLDAVSADDEGAMSLARHALRGLCGSFGAIELDRLLSTDLRADGATNTFEDCLAETVRQIRTVARA